jgi:hypothetical protein
METSVSGDFTPAGGLRSSAFTKLNTVALAPIAIAIVKSAIAVNPGALAHVLSA